MMALQRILLLLSLLSASCALPPRELEQQSAVPAEELQVVSLVREGLFDLKQNRLVDAEFKFRQSLLLYPRAQNVQLNLAYTLGLSGAYDESIALYRELIAANRENIQFHAGLARVFIDSGSYDEGRAAYERALDIAIEKDEKPRAANLARNLAALLYRTGAEEEAYCYALLALALNPARDETVLAARIMLGRELPRRALEIIDLYQRDRPGERDPDVLHQRALAEGALGNFDEAVRLEGMAHDALGDQSNVDVEKRAIYLLLRRLSGAPQTAHVESEEEGPALEASQIERLNTLYWPTVLVKALSDYMRELEQE